MSEMCLSRTTSKSQFTSLLLSDLFHFCSFILSHPLYLSYFIFFSLYLLKFLSFLSPLFLTTSLLLLSLLFHHNSTLQSSQPKLGFLLSTCQTIVERIRSKISDKDHEEYYLCNFEEFELYRIVFDTRENYPIEVSELTSTIEEEKPSEVAVMETQTSNGNEKNLESLLKELDNFEKMDNYTVEKKKIEAPCAMSNKVVVGELQKEEPLMIISGSEVTGNKISQNTVEVIATDNGREYTSNVNNVNDDVVNSDSSQRPYFSLGSHGSMRREKEWNRTLACKLFEERHGGGGEEGMDSLWETYEVDSSKARNKRESGNKENKNKNYEGGECNYDDDEEEEEELLNGQLCCLQALKFSTGKMNLAMGRPSLVKISKALKGIGWLHHVSKNDTYRHQGFNHLLTIMDMKVSSLISKVPPSLKTYKIVREHPNGIYTSNLEISADGIMKTVESPILIAGIKVIVHVPADHWTNIATYIFNRTDTWQYPIGLSINPNLLTRIKIRSFIGQTHYSRFTNHRRVLNG